MLTYICSEFDSWDSIKPWDPKQWYISILWVVNQRRNAWLYGSYQMQELGKGKRYQANNEGELQCLMFIYNLRR